MTFHMCERPLTNNRSTSPRSSFAVSGLMSYRPLVERLLKTYEPIADDFVGSILSVIEEAYSDGPSIGENAF